jgi:hypothetical protein
LKFHIEFQKSQISVFRKGRTKISRFKLRIELQKSLISDFGKGLTLFEFENRFDLDSNLCFKFKSCSQKFKNLFYFSSQPKSYFSPELLAAHQSPFPFPATSAQPINLTGPIPSRLNATTDGWSHSVACLRP